MIIDIHAHLWADHYKRDKKVILHACKLFGIDKIYISTIMSYYPDYKEIDYCNKLTQEFAAEYPDLIEGYVYINPMHENKMDVLTEGISNGMRGVKLWVATTCDDDSVDPIAKKCVETEIPILVHAFHKATGQLKNESTAKNVRCLALRYPKLKIIMAHMGGNVYHGLRCIADLDNVYTDISGTMVGTGDLNYAIELVGEDRLLFGTDLPGGGRQCFAQVEEAGFTQEVKEKIYYKNALELFGGNQ